MMPPNGVIPDDEPESSAPARTPARTVLGSVQSLSTAPTGASQLAPSLRVAGGKNPNGAKMDIFVDQGGRGSDDGEASEWADLGTRDGRRKENTMDAHALEGRDVATERGQTEGRPAHAEIGGFPRCSESFVPPWS